MELEFPFYRRDLVVIFILLNFCESSLFSHTSGLLGEKVSVWNTSVNLKRMLPQKFVPFLCFTYSN